MKFETLYVLRATVPFLIDQQLITGGIVTQDIFFITVNASSSITLTATMLNFTTMTQVYLIMIYIRYPTYIHIYIHTYIHIYIYTRIIKN